MAKRVTTEEHLALLRELRAGDGGGDAVSRLDSLLTAKSLHGIVIKGAAELAERWEATGITERLCAILLTLLDPEAAKRDPGCEGKTAALKALVSWDSGTAELYRRAASYTQREPVFGGSRDTAGIFRGLAAIGLAQARPENAILLITDLLADEEKEARLRAAQALGIWPGPEALPLLRLKSRLGDADLEVMGEVFAALLAQDAAQLPMIVTHLQSKNDGLVEAAALALGQSRLEGALNPLTQAWQVYRRGRVGSSILMAIALLRSDASLDWLLKELAQGRVIDGAAILDALAIYRGDDKIIRRIQEIASRQDSLKNTFAEIFG